MGRIRLEERAAADFLMSPMNTECKEGTSRILKTKFWQKKC